MKCHEQRLSKLVFSTALPILLPLLTAVCLSVGSEAVDPRIQYSTYLSGSKTTCMKRISMCILFCLCWIGMMSGQDENSDITGKGTKHFIPKFTSPTTIGNSRIFQSASISPEGWLNLVGIGTTNPDSTLHVNVGPYRNAFSLGDHNVQSLLIRDTAQGLIDIQTGPFPNVALALQCCGGDIFMFAGVEGHLGIGTGEAANIITVKQNSDTDPIADAWTTYSSARWKTNIQPIGNALDKVEHLRGVAFDWKVNGKHDIGVVAEEVAAVVPEVVGFENDGKAQSVDYGRLTALLVEAIKEQQAEIRVLKGKIQELAHQTNNLQAMSATGTN